MISYNQINNMLYLQAVILLSSICVCLQWLSTLLRFAFSVAVLTLHERGQYKGKLNLTVVNSN